MRRISTLTREYQPSNGCVISDEHTFVATMPDQLWAAEITEMPSAEDFHYLAVILDEFGRRVIGYARLVVRRAQKRALNTGDV